MKLKLFALFCVFALLLGCTVPGIGEKNLVPSKANFVMTVKVADFFNDADIQDIMREQSQDFEEQLQQTYEETGIDIKKMTKAVIFGDSSSFSNGRSAPYAGGIIYGQFDQAKIVEKIKKEGTMAEQSYEGVALYVDEESDSASAFVEGAIVAGTTRAVKDVIDVSKGKQQALNNDKLNAVSSNIDAGSMVAVVAIVPSDVREQIASSPSGGPVNTQHFSKVSAAGLSLNKQGASIDLKVAMLVDDAASAGKVEDVLSGLVSMGKGMAEPGSTTEAVLEKISVSSSGSMVKVSLSTTKTELEELSEELGALYAQPAYVAQPAPSYDEGGAYGGEESYYGDYEIPPVPEE